MSKVGKLWAGNIYGTNTGKVFLEVEAQNENLIGTLRLLDDKFGVAIYSISGSFDGASVKLKGLPTKGEANVELGEVEVHGDLTPEGEIRGQWRSTIGTGGTFRLYPHDAPRHYDSSNLPEQLHSASRTLGAVRLYGDDVRQVIEVLAKDFTSGRVVVTYRDANGDTTKYASDFERELSKLGALKYLKLVIQEPEAHGINRMATVELNAHGNNEIRVHGVHETWVVGKVESLAAKLRTYQKTFATTFRKFGLNINGIVFLIVLVLLPDLSLPRRVIFLGFVLASGFCLLHIHTNLIPNALIQLSDKKPSALSRLVPQILSWTIAASAGIVSAIAYGLLKGELPWFSN